jgi:hypothetical protein
MACSNQMPLSKACVWRLTSLRPEYFVAGRTWSKRIVGYAAVAKSAAMSGSVDNSFLPHSLRE